MVKVEDSWDSDGSSEYNLVKGDVGPSSSKPSAPILVKQESLPSSSSGHLRSYFLGMGFSSVLVDKVLEENGDADVNLLLEALFRYSKSSPNASDSLDEFSVSDMGGDNSPIGFASDDVKQEIKEPNGNLNDDLDKRSHLAVMNFSEEEIGLAIDRLGENASLDELVDFIVTAQTTGYSGGEGMDGSANVDHGKDEEATTAALYGTADKTLALLQMGFTENEVSSAIKNFGPEVPISELADSIFANRLACKVEKEEDFSDTADNITWQNQNGLGCRDNNTEEYPKFSRSFNDPWISKVSSSKAATYGYEDVNGTKKAKLNDPWISKVSSSNFSLNDYEDVKAVNKAKQMYGKGKAASCSNHLHQDIDDDWDETKPNISYEPAIAAEARFIKEEMPEPRTPNVSQNGNSLLSRPPYFFYANIVDVSQKTWRKLSQFLYGIEPEHVNCQFFSAFIRKEGYLHNLPTERRFHIVPKPPMTIEDALPHTKKWWPSWDTRKQLSCISSGTAGVVQLCERLGKTMMQSQGLVSRAEQVDILHQCKRLNLIWVGLYKLSFIEPDQVETILGYPRQHTEFWGQPTDRLEALKHSFQTDTIGYHLSVLKGMYPSGLRVLSIFSGIGGAEIALHRLGIRLKCVVSVEASEINRRILKRWWVNTKQTGVLKQIGGIEKLTIQTLESLIGQFGGFDIIIGGNPGDTVHGCYNGDSQSEMDLNLFFEFVRVFQRVRSSMGRSI
ncbi:putative inactive DNA (cytosine-5)-methyltransferase DRM3 isoform X1 [Iris pallida]|uniref:DNA (cytosine-5-)-methyltransferase n=1 Tax=Iris pallida TaxID=29817 RepID=A0AAX6F237_IRIPA|nr:putative inactive DNA (cytosine-5)-methyltransferase DRM3 isoform X1 [Iris pallida]KAJ6810198.1 putative inactive DNA (cytosine-5)-methyltransferase DRM3 isoform X1 [Iris pallida]